MWVTISVRVCNVLSLLWRAVGASWDHSFTSPATLKDPKHICMQPHVIFGRQWASGRWLLRRMVAPEQHHPRFRHHLVGCTQAARAGGWCGAGGTCPVCRPTRLVGACRPGPAAEVRTPVLPARAAQLYNVLHYTVDCTVCCARLLWLPHGIVCSFTWRRS